MIDDLNRMEFGQGPPGEAASACSRETCSCQCSCTQCQCSCSTGDYAYDQDNTYLYYPSDRTSVSGNLIDTSLSDIWGHVMLPMAGAL